SNLDLDGRNSIFGRVNYARKSAEDLAVVDSVPATEFNIGSVELGYVRELGSLGRTTIGVGATGTLGFIPVDLEPVYGTRTPTGLAVYLRIRPTVMQMGHDMDHPMMPRDSMPMDSMPGMPMSRDSMPGMHTPHDSMPGMRMPGDSMPRKRTPHDSMPGMRMPMDSGRPVESDRSSKRRGE
ncbi:MAG TPA: hypothetical protein VGR09_00800, partial [Gemmatimonadales bacterium]|nr:hypothetical protein [Gemmatimonadales bacterium]